MLLMTDRCQSKTAQNGPKALALEFLPHCVLIDIGLPKMSGQDLAIALRKDTRTRNATFIATSGFGQIQLPRQTHPDAFDHQLVKPVDPNTLLQILANSTRPTAIKPPGTKFASRSNRVLTEPTRLFITTLTYALVATKMTSTRTGPSSLDYPMLTTRAACRILIVDDNLDLARSMSMLLSHYGFPVATAADGRTAIETARSFRPKVVLLDIGLPDIDGYHVAKALRNDVGLNESTLIAISANDPLSRSSHSPVSCFDHYLVKPVDLDLLLLLFPKTSDDFN